MELIRFVQEEYLEAFTLPGMQGVVSILPGPLKEVKRSIEKTIRAYRGNFRRLTDLVRTTIVFRKFEDIQKFSGTFARAREVHSARAHVLVISPHPRTPA